MSLKRTVTVTDSQAELDKEQALADLDQRIADREQVRTDHAQLSAEAERQQMQDELANGDVPDSTDLARITSRQSALRREQEQRDSHQQQLDEIQQRLDDRQSLLESDRNGDSGLRPTSDGEIASPTEPTYMPPSTVRARARAALARAQAATARAEAALRRAELTDDNE